MIDRRIERDERWKSLDQRKQQDQGDESNQSAPMISLSKMTATLVNGKKLLNDISFSLPKGAKLAVIGANGSGKSTLMRGLLGMIPTATEYYKIAGYPFSALTIKARAKLIGYIGQQQQPEAETTVWEWCELSRIPYRTSIQRDQEVIVKSLEACNALSLAARKLISLSGGEQQRVYLAGVLAQETPIIILDEVHSAMDPKYREAMNYLIASLHDQTIVSVTHDINSLHHYSHILALKEGKVIAFGTGESVLNQALLAKTFDYEFTEIWHDQTARYF